MKFSWREQIAHNQEFIKMYDFLIKKAENWDNSLQKSQIPDWKKKKWEYIRENRQLYKEIWDYIKRKEQKKK
jgi:hypothetical protein